MSSGQLAAFVVGAIVNVLTFFNDLSGSGDLCQPIAN